MRFNKVIIFINIIVFTSNYLNAQQAWTLPKGKFYSQVGFTYNNYNGIMGNEFEVKPLGRDLTQHTLEGFFQYGITDKLMTSLVIPYVFSSSARTSNQSSVEIQDGNLNSLSNLQLGFTYLIKQKSRYVYSLEINTSFPTARYQAMTGLRSGEDAFSFEPSFLIGMGHKKYFLSGSFGFSFKSNDYSDQIIGRFQIGKTFTKSKKLTGIFDFNIAQSLKNGNFDNENSIFTGAFLNDRSYLVPGIKLGYEFIPGLISWFHLRAGLPRTENVEANTSDSDYQLLPFTISISYSNK